jgi:hypothetical protein
MKSLPKQGLGTWGEFPPPTTIPFKNNGLPFFMQAFTRNGGASYHS